MDSGEEDGGGLVNNLNGRQLNAACEIRVTQASANSMRCCLRPRKVPAKDSNAPCPSAVVEKVVSSGPEVVTGARYPNALVESMFSQFGQDG